MRLSSLFRAARKSVVDASDIRSGRRVQGAGVALTLVAAFWSGGGGALAQEALANQGAYRGGALAYDTEFAGSFEPDPTLLDGRTEMMLGGDGASYSGGAPVEVEGLPLVGDFVFGGGLLYGCYDPETRVLQGVWTQADSAPVCPRAVGGRGVWGDFKFAFSKDGRDFKGFWTSCESPARANWRGWLQGTPIQAPDMRDPKAMLDALPYCDVGQVS